MTLGWVMWAISCRRPSQQGHRNTSTPNTLRSSLAYGIKRRRTLDPFRSSSWQQALPVRVSSSSSGGSGITRDRRLA